MKDGKMEGKSKILVIDDEPDILEIVSTILENEGFEVSTAADGQSGVIVAKEFLPDLIVLDMNLPGMDGWKVQDRFQESEELAKIPVIVLTARDSTITRIINEEVYSVFAFITKPFNPNYLVQTVNNALNLNNSKEIREE